MDIVNLFQIVGKFFKYYCAIQLQFGAVTFTVGQVLLFCGIATILIWFVRGLCG